MLFVIILLMLKWGLAVFLTANNLQAELMVMPILGLAGSPYLPLMLVAAIIDLLIIWTLIRKQIKAVIGWLVISFLATFASGYIDIAISGMLVGPSNKSLKDAALSTLNMYKAIGPGVIVEFLLGTVHLIIDGVWHVLLMIFSLRRSNA